MHNLKESGSIKKIANNEALPLKVIQLDVDDVYQQKCNTRNNI
jgi:hypothetical protein